MNKINQLEKLRKEIDNVNRDLVKIIAKRFRITDKVKKLKIKNYLPAEDKDRELKIMYSAENLANKLKINPQLVKDVLRRIIEEAKK